MCLEILKETLNEHRVVGKFVQRLLTDEQKENRATVSRAEENFLENAITGDETWIYGYDVEIKSHCHRRLERHHLNLKRAH